MRILLLVLLASCTRSTAEVQKETKEAVNAAVKLVTDSKDDYVARTEDRVRDANRKIDELNTDIDKKTGEAKKTAELQLDGLRKQRDELSHELTMLKQDTADTWHSTQRKIDAAGDAFEESFRDLKKRLDSIP